MIKFILGLLLGILCIIFFIQNGEVVSVSFLAWSLTLPRFILFGIFLFSGIIIGSFISSLSNFKKKKRNKK